MQRGKNEISAVCNLLFNAGLSRVVFAAYNNLDRWLQPRDTNQSSGQPLANTGSPYRVRSRVVSASINEPSGHSGSMKKLEEPVEFVLRHNNVSNQLLLGITRCAVLRDRLCLCIVFIDVLIYSAAQAASVFNKLTLLYLLYLMH